MVSSLCLMTGLGLAPVLAAPSPIDDEDFLLFLADSLEDEEGTLDPLSMIEDQAGEPQNKDKTQEQEDKHEQEH